MPGNDIQRKSGRKGCVIEQVKGVTEEASEEHPKLRTKDRIKTAERVWP